MGRIIGGKQGRVRGSYSIQVQNIQCSHLHHWKRGLLVKATNLTCGFCHSNDFWQIWDSILRNTHWISRSCPVQTQTSCYRLNVMVKIGPRQWPGPTLLHLCATTSSIIALFAHGFCPHQTVHMVSAFHRPVCANVELRISLAWENTDTEALSCLKIQCKYKKATCCNRKWPFSV